MHACRVGVLVCGVLAGAGLSRMELQQVWLGGGGHEYLNSALQRATLSSILFTSFFFPATYIRGKNVMLHAIQHHPMKKCMKVSHREQNEV